MKKGLSILVASLMIVAGYLSISQVSYAFPRRGEFGPPPEFMHRIEMEVLKQLDLTEGQKQKLSDLDNKTKEKMKELREKMRETMKALKEEMEKYKSNEKILRGKIEEAKNIGGEILELKIQNFLQLKKILTKEQFEEFIKNVKIQMRIMMRKRFKKKGDFEF